MMSKTAGVPLLSSSGHRNTHRPLPLKRPETNAVASKVANTAATLRTRREAAHKLTTCSLLDGRPGAPGTPGRLIIPGQEGQQSGPAGPMPGQRLVFNNPNEQPEGGFYQPFRRPTDQTESQIDRSLSVEDILKMIREQRGAWYQLAPYLTHLKTQGVLPDMVDKATGMTPRAQNDMVIAAGVFTPLLSNNNVSETCKNFFKAGNQEVLLEMRVVTGKFRIAALEYTAENHMTGLQARDLARAVKNYEKRSSAAKMEGFTESCGDILGLKYYREACEVSGDARDEYVEKGLQVATSESAREALSRLIETKVEEVKEQGVVGGLAVSVIELDEEEQGFWPLAVTGTYGSLTAAQVLGVPTARVSGKFRIFNAAGSPQWAAIPLYPSVAVADDPVAVLVPNTTELTALMNVNTRATEALMVVDRGFSKATADGFYLASSTSAMTGIDGSQMTKVEVFDGKELLNSNKQVLGKVVLVIRPPDLDKDMYDPNEGSSNHTMINASDV